MIMYILIGELPQEEETMQTIIIELRLNASFYQEQALAMSKDEMKRELRREIKDQVNELNLNGLLNLMLEIPVLPMTPKIVLTTES